MTPTAWQPVRPETRPLTTEEIAQYEQQGFVVVPEVFDRSELAAINAEIDRIRAEKQGEGDNPNFLFALGLRTPLTQRICAEPRVLELVASVVSPGISIYSAKMVEKQPYDQTICHWHQDNAYYNEKARSTCRMSIWLPLQDTNVDNGGLWVVPGSHQAGTRPARKRPDGICAVSFADGREPIDGAMPVAVDAGDLLLFHADLWHRSLENRTGEHRRTFIVSYQEATAGAGNGPQYKVLRPAHPSS